MKTYDQFISESVRDLMTPKPMEHFSDFLFNKMNKDKYMGYFNPLDWGLTLMDYDGTSGLNDYHVLTFKSQDGRRWKITIDERGYFPLLVKEIKRGVSEQATRTYSGVEDYLQKRGLVKRISESVRSKMTPKSEEDIKKSLSEIQDPQRKLEVACNKGLVWLAEQAIAEGVELNNEDTDFVQVAHFGGYTDLVVYLLNKGAHWSVHESELESDIDKGEIESQLNQDGIYEGDSDFEVEMKKRYEYLLKLFFVTTITEKNTGELPINYWELVDTIKIREVSSGTYISNMYHTYEIKIDEPIY